tara:strand:+ start:101 stop:889 length:789 start_codon:yes stop_codon:yes gene_type:complete
MGSTNGNGGGGDVDASTDPFGKETMSKSYQDRESVPDRDTSLDTKNPLGTPYSPELAEAVKAVNEKAAQRRAERALGLNLQSMQANAIANTPGLTMADYSPSNIGGVNPTAGLSLGQSLGFTGAQLGQSLGNFGSALANMSPQSIGLGIVGALAGIPGLGFVSGLFGDDEASDDPGNLGLPFSAAPNSVVNNLGFTPIGTDVSPAPSMEPDRGGNKPILPIETPPTSEELITQNPLMPMMTDQQRLAMLYRLPTGGITNFLT